MSNYVRKQFIHRSICLRFINRWKLAISGRHRKEEKREQGKREAIRRWMVEWITQDTFLEQRVHPSVLMHSLERREQGYFCRFVYARRRRSRINLSLDILLPGILERVKDFRFEITLCLNPLFIMRILNRFWRKIEVSSGTVRFYLNLRAINYWESKSNVQYPRSGVR